MFKIAIFRIITSKLSEFKFTTTSCLDFEVLRKLPVDQVRMLGNPNVKNKR